MASNLLELPTWNQSGSLLVVVEAPRGATVKLKYDPALHAFAVSRPLNVGMSYPYDWGFIPGTRAEDGDPLDAMVLSEGGTCAGAVWACRPIGALRLLQPSSDQKQRVHNDRVLAVPTHEARLSDLRDIRDLSSRERAELEQFFLAIVALDKPGVELAGWQGPDAATDLIRRLSQ